MASRFEDFLEKTQGAADLATLNAMFQAEVASEGYDNVVLVRSGRNRLTDLFFADLPSGYTDTYTEQNWQMIDPILRQSRIAQRPFVWADALAGRELTKREKSFFADCKTIGVHDGITMPFHGPYGGTHVLSVSMRGGAARDARRAPYIYALATQTWIRHCALANTDQPVAPAAIHLTDRERECLKWAKDGKTNWEISQIIAVAERTVEFHIGNAMRKLNATNRVTAIVIAIQEGLIGI
jgi:DNA-binding CsgD family transcriptional regulator